jgi:hypothetical protein
MSCAFRITISAVTQLGRVIAQRDFWPIADRPAGAFRSELPIALDRELMSHDYADNGPATTGERLPLGQVRALPVGEAGSSACSARANTNARARFLAGDGLPSPPPPKPQACIVCSELVTDRVNRACRTRHAPPGATSGGPGRNAFTILSAIYRAPGSQDLLAGNGPAGAIRADAGVPGTPAREPARRDVIATARIRGRRPGQIYWPAGLLDHQQPDISSAATLRWRNRIFCAAGAWSENQPRWQYTRSNSSFGQSASPARTSQWEAMG